MMAKNRTLLLWLNETHNGIQGALQAAPEQFAVLEAVILKVLVFSAHINHCLSACLYGHKSVDT